ncbi:hypothetical protein H696_00813 [Fonticula alba]|uniref:tRNA (guanine-N(7)-)-methyltransferase non-catalytic subunit n=1 Tax=Fonticula alba TaxID=691883 RepID=A0A058ZH29_FONAL|nr:hypothetical protein H696_00813 [Fonticula alba]KCV73271.1 hypothetical protein H696_00813 [Fonticula alba]|eukprot:XP_009492972.1 hypothetical protein H696_00813 [Fonticula alba]
MSDSAFRQPFSFILDARDNIVLIFGNDFQIVNKASATITHSTRAVEGAHHIEGGHTTPIVAAALSPGQGHFVTSSNDRIVTIWDTATWTVKSSRPVNKRITSIKFNKDEDTFIVADKFGDLLSININNTETLTPLLSHLTIVTDFAFARDGSEIVSADRDEKIRISRFPKCHLIDGFCFGHDSYVTRLQMMAGAGPDASDILLSGGGDGLLIAWNLLTGSLVQRVSITDMIEQRFAAGQDAEKQDVDIMAIVATSDQKHVAVAVEDYPGIFVFNFDASAAEPLSFSQTLRVSADHRPTALAIDAEGRLFVGWSNGTQLLSAFDLVNGKFEQSSADIVTTINNSSSVRVVTVPSMLQYLQLRSGAQKTRVLGREAVRGDTDLMDEDAEQPDAKRVKTDE